MDNEQYVLSLYILLNISFLGDQGTLVSLQDGSSAGTFVNHSTGTGDVSDGTMINYR